MRPQTFNLHIASFLKQYDHFVWLTDWYYKLKNSKFQFKPNMDDHPHTQITLNITTYLCIKLFYGELSLKSKLVVKCCHINIFFSSFNTIARRKIPSSYKGYYCTLYLFPGNCSVFALSATALPRPVYCLLFSFVFFSAFETIQITLPKVYKHCVHSHQPWVCHKPPTPLQPPSPPITPSNFRTATQAWHSICATLHLLTLLSVHPKKHIVRWQRERKNSVSRAHTSKPTLRMKTNLISQDKPLTS